MELPFVLMLLALVAVVCADVDNDEWQTFKQKHRKQYSNSVHETWGKYAYERKKNRIQEHNQQYAAGQVSFKLGMNEFSDIRHEEFVRTMNGYRPPLVDGSSLKQVPDQLPVVNLRALPASVDWRDSGYVTPVKNQGQCGSCWAFSATGALEGQNFRKTGKLVPLSEQNLVDCAGSKYSSYGCNGGWMNGAFSYVKANRGINIAAAYPYTARQGTCRYSSRFIGATAKGYVILQSGSEAALQNAVATVGPVAIAIDAGRQSFQSYKSGVYYDAGCSSTNLNHGVLAVGYGTDALGGDYWLVKNSWGTSWGEQGYIRIARNRNNHCGVATAASYPKV